MTQTGYLGYTTFSKNLPYNGGFCKWYYIDKAQLLSFPDINPLTQCLIGEPQINGAWCGPVIVPKGQLGFIETPKRDNAGLYYEYKISGFYPGDYPASRINIDNMHHYQFVVVGKMRAGGMYLIIGNNNSGLQFDATYNSTANNTAGHTFNFTGSFIDKALTLGSFQGLNVLPSLSPNEDNGSSSSAPDYKEPEIITFSATQTNVQIPWTASLRNRFGSFPVIEVWYNENGILTQANNAIISVDSAPPTTSLFMITLNVPGPGIVVIK